MKIFIPAYNFFAGVDKILNEIGNTLDIIIVDNSENEEIKQLSKLFSRIEYFKIEKKGWQDNWNQGLKKTRNDFTICLCHNELISKKHIKILTNLNLKKNVLYFFDYKVYNKKYIKNKNLPNFIRRQLIKFFPKLIFFFNYLGPISACTYYNDNNCYFDENLNWLTDTDFIYRLMKNKKIEFLPINVSSFLQNESLTNNMNFKIITHFKELIYLSKLHDFSRMKLIFYFIFGLSLRILRKFFLIFKI